MTSAALSLLASTNAAALESGFYMGAVGGQTSIDIDKGEYDRFERYPNSTNFSSTLEDSDTGFGLYFGGQFGRWFAVEAQLVDLGKYTYKATQTRPNLFGSAPRNVDVRSESSTEAAVGTVSGLLTVPVGEQVAIGLRLGFSVSAAENRYEYEERRGNSVVYSESFDNDAEASDVSATYGVSLEWDPARHFGMRLEYQRFNDVGAEDDDYDYIEHDDEDEHGGSDVDLISLSLIARF